MRDIVLCCLICDWADCVCLFFVFCLLWFATRNSIIANTLGINSNVKCFSLNYLEAQRKTKAESSGMLLKRQVVLKGGVLTCSYQKWRAFKKNERVRKANYYVLIKKRRRQFQKKTLVAALCRLAHLQVLFLYCRKSYFQKCGSKTRATHPNQQTEHYVTSNSTNQKLVGCVLTLRYFR